MQGPWNSTQWEPGNLYRYNGKELNTDLGLDWYDYGARWYDAGIGRFTGVDPIADEYVHVTNYNYAENEPVRHIDLWGLQKELPPSPAVETTTHPRKIQITFTYNDNCRDCGTDKVTESQTTERVFYDEEGVERQRVTTLTITTTEVDEDGNTSTASRTELNFVTTNGEGTIEYSNLEKGVDLDNTSLDFQNVVSVVSATKKDTGKSPVQIRAQYNAENKDAAEVISTIAGGSGFLVGKLPGKRAKAAALILEGISAISGTFSSTIETNPEKIKLKQ